LRFIASIFEQAAPEPEPEPQPLYEPLEIVEEEADVEEIPFQRMCSSISQRVYVGLYAAVF
jgi:hypothetical protein